MIISVRSSTPGAPLGHGRLHFGEADLGGDLGVLRRDLIKDLANAQRRLLLGHVLHLVLQVQDLDVGLIGAAG